MLEGLRREDLFTVVHEQFATDTVDYADIVLPATTQLEHVDLHGSYGHFDVMHNPPAIAPRGECRSNNDVFRSLASRLGFEPELFPDDETLIGEVLDGGPTLRGITLDRLKAEGSVRLNIPEAFAPFADGVFPTPSGKCELYSERMKADGFDPLPTYTPPLEDPLTRPDLAARFPLQLLSPPRPQFLNSTFANSARHRAAAGEPTVELAAEDARSRGLDDGEWAEVYNDRGRFRARRRPDRRRPARRGRRDRHLLEQARARRSERQQHDVDGPDRHGRRRDLLRQPGRGAAAPVQVELRGITRAIRARPRACAGTRRFSRPESWETRPVFSRVLNFPDIRNRLERFTIELAANSCWPDAPARVPTPFPSLRARASMSGRLPASYSRNHP